MNNLKPVDLIVRDPPPRSRIWLLGRLINWWRWRRSAWRVTAVGTTRLTVEDPGP